MIHWDIPDVDVSSWRLEVGGEFAWRSWSFEWDATTGDHELACRATDAAGNVQPVEQPWNYQGMGNNLVQTVPVTVRT